MPCVDSINKAVCFDHFFPFSSSFGTILVQNCCDYLWRKTDIDIIRDVRLRFVSGGSAPTQFSCLHVVMLWPSFAFKFSCYIAPTAGSK